MSADYFAHAIVGVAIDATVFEEKVGETVPSCLHPEREGNKFCPVCGERVGDRTLRTPRFTVDGILAALPGGYREVTGGKFYRVVIGLGPEPATMDSALSQGGVPDVEEVRATLKAVLEPLGLWEKSRFGLHAVLDCLY